MRVRVYTHTKNNHRFPKNNWRFLKNKQGFLRNNRHLFFKKRYLCSKNLLIGVWKLTGDCLIGKKQRMPKRNEAVAELYRLAYVRSSVCFECLNRLKRMKLQERMRRALPLDDSEDDTRDIDDEYQEYQ